LRKLAAIAATLAATVVATPAFADTQREQQEREEREARSPCAERDGCVERRTNRLWFYRGHDEYQRPFRRPVRRLSAEG
jgi:hypothetical protein